MSALQTPTILDGSHGEGGGALLRTALVMSVLTLQPLRIENIRGATNFPGLDYEDWLLVKTLAQSCGAETVGAEIGSTSVSFLPTRRPKGISGLLNEARETGRRSANVPTVAAALLPVAARSGMYSDFTLVGETFGKNSLSYDYFAQVSLGALKRFGLYAFPDLEQAGYGRDSSGRIRLEVEPSALAGVEWPERGRLLRVRGIVTTSELPPAVGQRGVAHLEQIGRASGVPIDAESIRMPGPGTGAHITVWAEYQCGFGGFASMGTRGLRIEALAQNAFESLLQWMATDATVDPFLVDQILIPAALADGVTTFKTSQLTQRFLTSVWVVKQFLPIHITIRGGESQPGSVTIRR
jgi:RNA 3'-terminal phosphate cyclase (ATP)